MIPLYDSSERSSFPFVNYFIIVLNVVAFYLQLSAGSFEQFILDFAFIPEYFSLANPISYITIFTSMFMHGGFLHVISNLWFLHIFGDNVEDRMGHFRYLLFYLLAGVAATLAQYILNPSSPIPLVGASGAISGVSGAYFVWFNRSRIKALVPFGFTIRTATLPAGWFLGYWFLIQIFSGFTTFSDAVSGESGGVAFFAHIGGFVFGWIIAQLFRTKRNFESGIIAN